MEKTVALNEALLAPGPTASQAQTQAAPPPSVDLTVLMPVYNEAEGVGPTLDRLLQMLRDFPTMKWEVVCVNDGSTDATAQVLSAYKNESEVAVLTNKSNRGYGAALKRGARRARGRMVALIDADGTYDPEDLTPLLKAIQRGADMAIGARVGQNVHIPPMRRPAKWALTKLAEFLAREPIPDLNSGLRVIRRELLMEHMGLLPDGFSLTTTLTLALVTGGWRVEYIPISYAKRMGQSSIRPIRDTLKFVGIILRTTTHFNPLRVFGPVSGALMLAGVGVGFISKFVFGELMDATSVTLFLGGLQLLATGLLADLIAARRS
jgi:glycosyltransferase involved in cell wall biosynthesis